MRIAAPLFAVVLVTMPALGALPTQDDAGTGRDAPPQADLADIIGPGSHAGAFMGPADDTDAYRIVVPAEKMLKVTVRGSASLVELYDEDGTRYIGNRAWPVRGVATRDQTWTIFVYGGTPLAGTSLEPYAFDVEILDGTLVILDSEPGRWGVVELAWSGTAEYYADWWMGESRVATDPAGIVSAIEVASADHDPGLMWVRLTHGATGRTVRVAGDAAELPRAGGNATADDAGIAFLSPGVGTDGRLWASTMAFGDSGFLRLRAFVAAPATVTRHSGDGVVGVSNARGALLSTPGVVVGAPLDESFTAGATLVGHFDPQVDGASMSSANATKPVVAPIPGLFFKVPAGAYSFDAPADARAGRDAERIEMVAAEIAPLAAAPPYPDTEVSWPGG